MSDAQPANIAEKLLLVGRVVRAHGVKGELKVVPETEAPERWQDVPRLYLGVSPEYSTAYRVAGLRFQQTKRGRLALVDLEGVGSRDEAQGLRKQSVFAHEDDLPELEEGEYFVHELVDAQVVLEDGSEVGRVRDVIQQPAHDVLVVGRDGQTDVLIPAVDAFVIEVDLEEGVLVVAPIEGMFE